jgi:meckelin
LLTERIVEAAFRFDEVVQFWLAQYSWDGVYKGLRPMTVELNQCREKNELGQIWRKFGTNADVECVVNITELNETMSTDFYEPFIEDGVDASGFRIIRPFPVVLRWYDGGVNEKDDQTTWRAVRRFYLYDNHSTPDSVSFVNSVKIYITIREDDEQRVYPPYFVLNRTSVTREVLSAGTESSDVRPTFRFIMNYSKDMSKFRQWLLIFPIILGVFAFLFAVARLVFISHVDGVYDYEAATLVHMLCVLLDTVAIFFWLVSSGFCGFQFVVFKWQKVLFWCLPEESFPEFVILEVFLIIAFVCSLISSLLRVFVLQTQNYIFLLDWESPHSDGVPISAWRRINVANEWNRIMSIRSYSIVFTLIVAAFVLEGFHVSRMSSPIPTPKLLDTGTSHFVLKYGSDAFLWLILIAAQYLWCHYVYWRFVGNPYFNFLDLCTMSNISVFITTSTAHGFYLHARSVHSHADVDMRKLSQALVDERSGLVGLRGLLPGQPEQVFECFFAREFAQHFGNLKSQITVQQKWFAGRHSAKEIPQTVLQSYQEVNKYLKTFFDRSASDNKFIVREADMVEKFFGQPPQTSDSIFNPIKDSKFKNVLLAGAEWNLMLTYLLMFAVVDWSQDSPAVAAFVVYIVDFLIVWLYQRVARAFLARSSLLDSRFILS